MMKKTGVRKSRWTVPLKLHVECEIWNRVSEKAPAHRVYPGLVAVNDGDLLQDALAQVRLPLAAQALPPAVTTVRQAATTDNSNTSLPLPATQPPARKRGVRLRRKVFIWFPAKKIWRKQEQMGNKEFSSVSQQQQQQSLYWPLIVNMFLWSIRLWANGGSPTHKITPPNSHLKLLLPNIKENLYKIFMNNIEMKEMWKPWGRIP